MREQVEVAVEAALEAGGMLRENFGQALTIERKMDSSLVTNLDKEAERIVLAKLKGAYPFYSILAEESGASGNNEYTWVIDPLDGTHNYIRGYSMYGVSIGLVHKGDFVAGVIYLPESDELYSAQKGQGAFKNGNRIFVSKTEDLSQSSLLYDSGLHTAAGLKLSILKEISTHFFNVRMFGASTRNLTYLAEGKADLLVEFDEKPWDFAAGAIILTEAGGELTTHNGDKVTIESRSYVAGNGILNLKVRSLVNDTALKLGWKESL